MGLALLKKVDRPRELKWYQAASMLYGDWGTSKAYVLGIAFALAGHASLYLLIAMTVLVIMVGCCYIIICKAYPDGGGVYSAVRSRSKNLAVIGALLLVADYVITAALSSIEAFHYFGVPNPGLWAIGALVLIGLINIMGPTKSGNVATLIALASVGTLITLCVLVFPHLREIDVVRPEGGLFANWTKFVGIVLALSGVEAIANSTGIMVEPVKRTAKRAILLVMLEVTAVTLILGAVMNSIPGLEGRTEDMIRAIAEHYVSPGFGKAIALVIGLLLLSACNTVIMDLVSIMFLMSKDRELPPVFGRLNRFGMPWIGLIIATLAPILVLCFEKDVTHLAALYAIGVVGAIAMNVGVCSVNPELRIKWQERLLLGLAALVLIAIEITIILEKRNAVIFAVCILAAGLSARAAAKWLESRRVIVTEALGVEVLTLEEAKDLLPLYKGTTLMAVKSLSPSLVEEAALHAKGKKESVVYALYVEEKPPGWAYPTEAEPSLAAVSVLHEAVRRFEEKEITCVPLWSLSDNAGATIVKTSSELGLDTVMIGATRRGTLERMLRGEVLKTITEQLPKEKRLIICN
jgi:amino acid transporter/nucleotide-binding universal stress UspA family protein